MRNFRDYDFWRDSIFLAKNIYTLTNSFPKNDAIINQMHRAAISISSNIAEGSSRVSSNEFARYLEISNGSAFELESQVELSFQFNYIDKKEYDKLISEIQSIERRLYAFCKKLRTK